MTKFFSSHRGGYSSGSHVKNIVRLIVSLPLLAIIIGSLSIATDAAIENLKYTKATDQILSIVDVAHKYAVSQPSFAQQPGEDLLDILVRAKQITIPESEGTPPTFYNPWHHVLSGMTSTPSFLKLTSTVPTHDCRRMAEFFIKSAKDFNIERVEVEESKSNTREVYRDTNAEMPSSTIIERACGKDARADLSVVFHIR